MPFSTRVKPKCPPVLPSRSGESPEVLKSPVNVLVDLQVHADNRRGREGVNRLGRMANSWAEYAAYDRRQR